MKVYLKIHSNPGGNIVAVCDEEVLGLSINTGKFVFSVNKTFYGGELLEIGKAIEILKEATNFNITGKNIVRAAIDAGLIHPDGVIRIKGIPHAIKFFI